MTPDLVNALFEFCGGAFVLMHVRRLLIDRCVRGVSLVATAFFTAWGLWNLYYYPSLGQWYSLFGGAFVVFSNIIWLFLMLYYRKRGPYEFHELRRKTWHSTGPKSLES